MRMARKLIVASFAGFILSVPFTHSVLAQEKRALPRFVSLKSDETNVRKGPSKSHDVAWKFARTGLPVEIIQEYDNWRKIRDWEGSEGWIHQSLLTGTRQALVAPWEREGQFEVRVEASTQSRVAILAEPFVHVSVIGCNGRWCKVSGDDWKGWIRQSRLWGVYPNENF